MCSGKSTLGRALAHALNVPFVDLDHKIEEQQGCLVKDIFAKQGEAEFRRIEQETLRELTNAGAAVIACGGGTPCAPGAMELMNDRGITVWLQPTWERLLPRLMHGRRKRPLIAHIASETEMLDFYTRAMRAREPYYSQAKHQFDSSFLENSEQINATIQRFKHQILSEP